MQIMSRKWEDILKEIRSTIIYDEVSYLGYNWVAQRPYFKSALRVVKMVLNTQWYLYWLKEDYLPQFSKIVEDMFILYSQEDKGAPIRFFNEFVK